MIGLVVLFALFGQAATLSEYVDPAGRFRFSYPSSFGSPQVGTNSGFGDRVAAVRFSNLAGLGGEAALTRGAPMLDIQAAGGLYDAIALEAFPDALRARIVASLPRLSPANLCTAIAQAQHLDAAALQALQLPPPQLKAVQSIDATRNVDPKVVRCDVRGSTVTFEKETSFAPGMPRQFVYGAVRFLPGAYSTFQFIRAGAKPTSADLEQMTALVNSLTSKP